MKKITKIFLGLLLLCTIGILYKDPYIFLGYKPYFLGCDYFLPLSDMENWKQEN